MSVFRTQSRVTAASPNTSAAQADVPSAGGLHQWSTAITPVNPVAPLLGQAGAEQLASQQAKQVRAEGSSAPMAQNTTATVGADASLQNKQITSSGDGKDAVRIIGDGAKLKNVHVTDNGRYGSKGGHTDAAQAIPRDQFIGGVLRDINVDGFHVNGSPEKDSVQGLFSSDGCLVNAQLKNGVLNMGSPNKLAFNGLASGQLDGFVDGDGQAINARLQPLRIGGNPGTGNVRVLSIDPKEHECQPSEIRGNNYDPASDKRREIPNPNIKQDIGLCDFRLDEFKRDVKQKTVSELLDNPTNKAKIDDWLEWVKTTEQPEFKDQYGKIKDGLQGAQRDHLTIDKMPLGGGPQGAFYQLVAESYGRRCDQAK